MRLTTVFIIAGGVIVTGAIAWWWTTFSYVIGYGYMSWPEAGRCLVHDSDLCALAKALCLGSHPRTVVTYWTSAFWLGVGMLSISLLTAHRRPEAL